MHIFLPNHKIKTNYEIHINLYMRCVYITHTHLPYDCNCNAILFLIHDHRVVVF